MNDRSTGLTIVCEPWRIDPLVLIHRLEARAMAQELEAAGLRVRLACLDERAPDASHDERLLLRVSDGRMLALTRSLAAAGIDYLGPAADVLARCYDKYAAIRRLSADGIDCHLLRPARSPIADAALSRRAIALARQGVEALGADWAVRVDLIHETATERLLVLECDAAPMISAQSAFAASLAAANISRAEQLQLLLA